MGEVGEGFGMIAFLRHIIHAAVTGPLVFEIGKPAFRPVSRIELFIAFRSKHVRAGMLFIDHNDSTRFHTLCDNGKKTVQVVKPAERADRDDHNVKLFLIPVINIIYVYSFKHAGETQLLSFFIGKGYLVFSNVKTNPFRCFSAFHQGKQFTSVIAAELTDHLSLGMYFPQGSRRFFVEKRVVFLLNAVCYIGSPGSMPLIKSFLPRRFISFDILFHIIFLYLLFYDIRMLFIYSSNQFLFHSSFLMYPQVKGKKSNL